MTKQLKIETEHNAYRIDLTARTDAHGAAAENCVNEIKKAGGFWQGDYYVPWHNVTRITKVNE